MTIKTVYGVLPYSLEVTDDIPDPRDAAVTNGPHIKMRPAYVGDVGLLKHEERHVEQWYENFLPWVNKTHLEREIEAYKVQLNYYPEDDTPEKRDARVAMFAGFLATGYSDFTITVGDAYLRLKS